MIARSGDDVVKALTCLDDAGRQAIAQKARARVLAGHTGLARARELAAALCTIAPAIGFEPSAAGRTPARMGDR